MVRRSVLVVALSIGILAPDVAAAKPNDRRVAGLRRPNLPRGWSWPPSPDTRKHGQRCMRDLRDLGVRFKRAPRRRLIATPVVVPGMKFGPVVFKPIYRKPTFVMDCRLARAFATHAGLLRALGIRELRFSSIYDYRRVRLHQQVYPALSRHALGLAVDVFEVVLTGGVKLAVKRDYWSSPALMVAEAALRASGDFRAILSPAVDPDSHSDHLHMEVKVEQPARSKDRGKRKQRSGRLPSPASRPAGSPELN